MKTIELTMLAAAAAMMMNPAAKADDAFEAKRQALLAKPRYMLTDNDGNDFVYYSTNRPITEKAFIDSRIGFVAKTKCETMIYCPWSAGFGYFTVPGIGDTYTNSVPYGDTKNPIKAFLAKGLDPLQMAIDFCRRERREIFLGLRVNDTHDASYDALFPPWKQAHPECLFGTKTERPARCAWSAVDFEQQAVRDYMKTFYRQFLERYDLDGVELDFNRHLQLFKSVANAMKIEDCRASERQLDLMSRFMGELRGISEEIGRRRDRPVLVAIRVPDSFELCRLVGIDLERWLREKSVDMVIVGGYYQIDPWRKSIARIHELGARAYVSIDESRIGWNKGLYRWGLIPGRDGYSFDVSRMAQSMAEGADGVCFFNHQGQSLANCASVDINRTEGIDKRYFAVERGSGGYEPRQNIFYGNRLSTRPHLDPAHPQVMSWFDSYEFEVVVGDDFDSPVARERPPVVTAKVLMDTPANGDRQNVALRVNGKTLGKPVYSSDNTTNGLFTFSVPLADVKKGPNTFELLSGFLGGKYEYRFIDFLLEVKYPKGK